MRKGRDVRLLIGLVIGMCVCFQTVRADAPSPLAPIIAQQQVLVRSLHKRLLESGPYQEWLTAAKVLQGMQAHQAAEGKGEAAPVDPDAGEP